MAGSSAFRVLTVNGEPYQEVLHVHRYKDGRDVYIQVRGWGRGSASSGSCIAGAG